MAIPKSDLGRFIRRVLTFGSLLLLFIVGAYFITGYLTRNGRLGTTYIKHHRLSALGSPKIVIIGGSSSHYGIESRILQDQLGKPVVNMGIQLTIGLNYYFSEIMEEIQSGDIVVLLAEPAHFFKLNKNGDQALYNLLSNYPQGITHLNKEQWLGFPKHIGGAIQENISYFITLQIIKRKGISTILENTNQFGDYLGHKGKSGLAFSKEGYQSLAIPNINENIDRTIDLLRIKQSQILSKGAELYIGFAPTAVSIVEPGLFKNIYKKVSAEFPNAHIGSPMDFVYPDSCFFDTPHHLLFEQREKYTTKIADRIWSLLK